MATPGDGRQRGMKGRVAGRTVGGAIAGGTIGALVGAFVAGMGGLASPAPGDEPRS
ncbi:MAG: hypothetical protein U0V56_11375 [Actinomycetota bacterium]